MNATISKTNVRAFITRWERAVFDVFLLRVKGTRLASQTDTSFTHDTRLTVRIVVVNERSPNHVQYSFNGATVVFVIVSNSRITCLPFALFIVLYSRSFLSRRSGRRNSQRVLNHTWTKLAINLSKLAILKRLERSNSPKLKVCSRRNSTLSTSALLVCLWA